MENIVESNKRIAKNAITLYLRMIITLLIGLYTSRVVLRALGIEDYGIYNVVGGFVTMFSVVSCSLQNAVTRFFTFEVGKGDQQKMRIVFSTTFYVMVALSVLIVILTESVGIWYLHNKLVIPESRFSAACHCFHLSVISFVLGLLSTPYFTAILAHERMSVYAYVSIIDSILKLVICFVVMASPIDKLSVYAVLLLCVSMFDWIIYWLYCRKQFEECYLQLSFDKTLYRKIFGFAGWNFIGSTAAVFRLQGASLLLNAFGGPIVNAANGIANTVSGVVSAFVNNFTQAFNPQITKRYANKEYDNLMQLIIYGSKYSYYLTFIVAFPFLLNTQFVLKLWLGEIPHYTVEFTRWILVYLLVESISKPIITAKNATGQIRNYQIVVGGILLLMLPLSYIGLKCGLSVVFVSVINVVTAMLGFLARMLMLRGSFPTWSSKCFIGDVVCPVFVVSIISCILPILVTMLLPNTFLGFILTSLVAVISTVVCIYLFGTTAKEKENIGIIATRIKSRYVKY